MRFRIILPLLLAAVLPANGACAKFRNGHDKTALDVLPSVSRIESGLSVKKADYVNCFGDAVRDVSVVDVFVISSGNTNTRLVRQPVMPDLAISFGPVKTLPGSIVNAAPVPENNKVAGNAGSYQTPVTEPGQKGERASVDNPEKPVTVFAPGDKHGLEPECLLATVQFGLDDASLKPAELQKLNNQVINPLKDVKEPVLYVHGYTCELGSKRYNDKLATRRAEEVAAFLEKNGMRPLVVTGEGECCYVSDDASRNRRAEVIYVNDKSAVNPKFCGPRDK